MLKKEPAKLIQELTTREKRENFFVIMADNPIFKKVLLDRLEQERKTYAKVFSGKNSVEDYVNYLSTCGMFAPAESALIDLPDKLTTKLWSEMKKSLARIPLPIEVSAYFFAPLSCKNILKASDFPKDSVLYFCYEPNEIELSKCAHALLLRYTHLAKKDKYEQQNLVALTLESYSNDLLSCDLHFARMEKGNLSFSAALAGNPEVNGFHVVDAIARREKHLIELRMKQCAHCAEEASSIFMAIIYFLKQVANLLCALEETKNLKLAFEQAKIPFPAQGRLQIALSYLNAQRLNSFFAAAALIEMEMRQQKNPHEYLSIELIRWIS